MQARWGGKRGTSGRWTSRDGDYAPLPVIRTSVDDLDREIDELCGELHHTVSSEM